VKKKMTVCFLAAAMVLSCASALADVKIKTAAAETGNPGVLEVVKNADNASISVTYAGQKENEYMVMAMPDSAVDSGTRLPTKNSIAQSNALLGTEGNVVVYMNQQAAGSDGKVKFNVYPNLAGAKTDEAYGIYISGTDSAMAKIGSFTLEELLAMLGDINGDGDVTATDRAMLARYVAKLPGWFGESAEAAGRTIHIENADLNNDGQVTPTDRAILARFVAKLPGWTTLPRA